jgi:hypothetical protein
MKSILESPIEAFFEFFPPEGYIYGSFARFLYKSKFHQNQEPKKLKMEEFLNLGSDIDMYLENKIGGEYIIKMMKLFGKVDVTNLNGDFNTMRNTIVQNRIIWDVDGFLPLQFDMNYFESDVCDFTINNFKFHKTIHENTSTWHVNCRVNTFSNDPHKNETDVLVTCVEDIYEKKINCMLPPNKNMNKPLIVARTYRLLNNGYSFDHDKIDALNMNTSRFDLEPINTNNECYVCSELLEDDLAVLDCKHAIHSNCLKKISKGNTNRNRNRIRDLGIKCGLCDKFSFAASDNNGSDSDSDSENDSDSVSVISINDCDDDD